MEPEELDHTLDGVDPLDVSRDDTSLGIAPTIAGEYVHRLCVGKCHKLNEHSHKMNTVQQQFSAPQATATAQKQCDHLYTARVHLIIVAHCSSGTF